MANRSKLGENKMKEMKSPAINTSESVAPSGSITTNVKIDGNKAMKSSQRSTDEILAAGNLLQLASTGTDDKEGGKGSTEVINEAEHSSDIKESKLTDKEIKKFSESIVETTRIFSKDNIGDSSSYTAAGNIPSTQYQGRSNSLLESRRDFYEFLRSKHPELVENAMSQIKLKAQSECLQKFSNILKKANEMPTSEAKEEVYRVLEELKEVTEEEFRVTSPDDNEITEDLEKDYRQKVRTKDCEGSVDDIQKATYSSEKLTVETKVEKDGNESTGNIQETENCSGNVESVYDDEPRIKIKDDIVESMGKAEDSFDLKHTNDIVNLNPTLTFQQSKGIEKCRRKDFYLKLFKKKRGLLYSEKEITGNAEAIETSKEQANQINDIIIEMKNVAIYEKVSKDYDSSTEYIDVAVKSPQNSTEDKREENKCKEDIDSSNDDIKDLNADKEMLGLAREMKHCKIKDSKNKTINPLKSETVPRVDFKPKFKDFLSRQKSKLNEEAKKYRDTELMKHKQDVFSLEKGPIKAVAGTESHGEATVATNQDEENAEVPKADKLDHESSETDHESSETDHESSETDHESSETDHESSETDHESSETDHESSETDHESSETDTEELNHEPSEMDIELKKNHDIHFEFQTNGDKHIVAVGDYYFYSSREKQALRFNYNDESIQVSFTGNQIFVSTPNSEFDISFRKSDPVNLTNEETQTENSPSVEYISNLPEKTLE